MPLNCCVPGCRGNYRATKDHPHEKVSVFKFPDDPGTRAKWIRMVPRKDLVVTDKTAVCEKHFSPSLVIRVDTVTRADGSVLSVPRKIPKLAADAYPSIFPNVPSYLSEEPTVKRKAPESRRAEMDARDEQFFQNWLSTDKINSFDELCDKMDAFMKDYPEWITSWTAEYICVCRIDFMNVPRITAAIRIDQSLHVDIFKGELQLDSSSLAWALGTDCVVKCWSELSTQLSYVTGLVSDGGELSIADTVACVTRALENLCQRLNLDNNYTDDVSCRLRFLTEQLSLLFATNRRYSPDMLMFAFRLMCVSRAAFSMLRDRSLILPHASYLRKLSSVFNVNGDLNEGGHVKYLREKCSVLQQHERHVISMLDEIHVNPKTTYKAGCLVGMASNSPDDEATTVQAFMICSLLSSNKDVAALIPVQNLNAAYLKDCTVKVIRMLESCGFLVLCLISDNNSVNRNMFTDLCGDELKPSVTHPCSSDRKLFFLFDSVHLLKCIRNNWLGQSDRERTFTFPDFSTGVVCKASISHIRRLYDIEKDSIVKLAPGLTHKALYPGNLERQNVQLALKIFDEKVIVALNHCSQLTGTDVTGTQSFVNIIVKLWKILNVKSPDKGYKKRDVDCYPIRDVSDERVSFLGEVFTWLCKWDNMGQKPREGRLTSETMTALKHTVSCFTQLIPYLLRDMHLPYVLTGKFQTDCLEARFGKYRQMCGTNYHVSVQQIRESEKKLKLLSLLHVVSASRGEISVVDFIGQCSDAPNLPSASTEEIVKLNLLNSLDLCHDMDVTEVDSKSIIFIAGYVGFKLVPNVHCDWCKHELINDETLQVDMSPESCEYLMDLDRGGLKWPTDLLVEAVTEMYFVFQSVLTQEFESKFLACSNQKSVLLVLFQERLQYCSLLEGESCCGLEIRELLKPAMPIVANIFFNNYCKRAADKRVASKDNCKRKLSTLTKK
jgi:hypothetical protein